MEDLDPWLDSSYDGTGVVSLKFCEDANDNRTTLLLLKLKLKRIVLDRTSFKQIHTTNPLTSVEATIS
jgi:hypothetical protein